MSVDHHLHFLQKNQKVSLELLQEYLEVGKKQGVEIFGFSEHAYLFNQAKHINFNQWQIDRMKYDLEGDYLEFIKKLRKGHENILIGLEVDYHPEKEKQIKDFTDWCRNKYDFDFFSGSIHWLDNWGIDLDEKLYHKKMNQKAKEQYIKQYFYIVEKLIRSKLFNFVCHIDLIKLFDTVTLDRFYFEKIIKLLKKFKLGIEINSNGMNRPVKETFPSFKMLEALKQNRIPITFSSDAHTAGRVGEHFCDCVKEFKKNNYKNLFYCRNFKYEFVEL